jgi:hypothetical protein
VRLKLKRREALLLALVAAAVVIWIWQPLSPESGGAPSARSRARPAEAPAGPIPRIDLARLEEPPADVEIGRRDLFAYDARKPAPQAAPATMPPPAPKPPRPVTTSTRGPAGGSGSSLPPMNLSFIGSVGNAQGVKVAVLVTERNEVLTGQPGDVIANRYRIEKIGIESVDLQDVGTGPSRRIPLKGK